MKPTGDIDGALAEYDRLRSLEESINLTKLANQYGVDRSTLSRRANGVTQSHEDYISNQCRHLNNAQEKVLLRRIDYLTDKALPPTPSMVKNMAEEICKHEVDKNWTSRFVQRHQAVLKSRYLRCIAAERIKAEYLPNFVLFFHHVSVS
jgi:Tc5 transposase DNA-binding domain